MMGTGAGGLSVEVDGLYFDGEVVSAPGGGYVTTGSLATALADYSTTAVADLAYVAADELASANQAAVAGSPSGTDATIITDLITLVNQLRADLVTAKVIKGSA
jgi:hypothetical protein